MSLCALFAPLCGFYPGQMWELVTFQSSGGLFSSVWHLLQLPGPAAVFVYMYLYLCICVYVFVYLCICICVCVAYLYLSSLAAARPSAAAATSYVFSDHLCRSGRSATFRSPPDPQSARKKSRAGRSLSLHRSWPGLGPSLAPEFGGPARLRVSCSSHWVRARTRTAQSCCVELCWCRSRPSWSLLDWNLIRLHSCGKPDC